MRRIGLLVSVFFLLNAGVAQAAVHQIDATRSKMTVYVYRSGLFAFAADNHQINAPIGSGEFDDPLTSVSLVVPAAQLTVVDPRSSADRRSQVQAKMLGPDVLDSARYPTIEFKSTSIEGSADKGWSVSGLLALHGTVRPIVVSATESGGHFHGTVWLKQTDFGISPITLVGGTVKVKNDVRIDFDIVAL
ncbi:MAG TPA: YceI family protein [Candidatus Eremiobacteraceae bacterium]|nr:YceI family protein [Candidatus Eremiobacteraceae bacterium]